MPPYLCDGVLSASALTVLFRKELKNRGLSGFFSFNQHNPRNPLLNKKLRQRRKEDHEYQ
jgi:hypothetical protein